MKKLLFTVTFLFATCASAGWEVNQNGVALQQEVNGNNVAVLEYASASGEFHVSFIDVSYDKKSYCNDGQSVVREVNGQPVRLYASCDRGMSRYYGLSDEAREFIVNEFKVKSSVKFGSSVYSAIGFTAAMEKVKKRKLWAENAL